MHARIAYLSAVTATNRIARKDKSFIVGLHASIAHQSAHQGGMLANVVGAGSSNSITCTAVKGYSINQVILAVTKLEQQLSLTLPGSIMHSTSLDLDLGGIVAGYIIHAA